MSANGIAVVMCDCMIGASLMRGHVSRRLAVIPKIAPPDVEIIAS